MGGLHPIPECLRTKRKVPGGGDSAPRLRRQLLPALQISDSSMRTGSLKYRTCWFCLPGEPWPREELQFGMSQLTPGPQNLSPFAEREIHINGARPLGPFGFRKPTSFTLGYLVHTTRSKTHASLPILKMPEGKIWKQVM